MKLCWFRLTLYLTIRRQRVIHVAPEENLRPESTYLVLVAYNVVVAYNDSYWKIYHIYRDRSRFDSMKSYI